MAMKTYFESSTGELTKKIKLETTPFEVKEFEKKR